MSEEDKIISETCRALGISQIVPDVYRDMLQPATQEFGEILLTVAKAVKIATAPLEGAVWGYEQIKQWLAVKLTQKLAHVPEKRIQAPPLLIAGPTILYLHFSFDIENMREMYANLLASAMDSDSVAKAHPSFVYVVQQLCSDEALIIKSLATQQDIGTICSETLDSNGSPVKGTNWLKSQFQTICESAGVHSTDLSNSYLDNLLRLKLLALGYSSEAEYIPEGADRYGDYGPSIENTFFTEIHITSFGGQFLDVCVR